MMEDGRLALCDCPVYLGGGGMGGGGGGGGGVLADRKLELLTTSP